MIVIIKKKKHDRFYYNYITESHRTTEAVFLFIQKNNVKIIFKIREREKMVLEYQLILRILKEGSDMTARRIGTDIVEV